MEQGKDYEMKHLQGMLQLMQKKRMRAVKKILKSCAIHLEGIRDVKAAVMYVNEKDNTYNPTTAFDINVCTGRAQKDIQRRKRMQAKRMDNFEQLYQDDDEDAVYLCHGCNSMITGHNFDKHQC